MTPPPPRRLYVYRRGTTSIPNSTVADERLSYSALGLLLVILARPESAPQGYRAYMARGTGQDAILSAFKQMAEAGYRHQITRHTSDGRMETYTVVAEEPIPERIAKEWLEEQLASDDRAWQTHARRDLRKHARAQAESANGAGQSVHANPVHGEPVHGSPVHGSPVHGEAMHKPSVSKGLSSLRSQDHEKRTTDVPPEEPIPPDFRARFRAGGADG